MEQLLVLHVVSLLVSLLGRTTLPIRKIYLTKCETITHNSIDFYFALSVRDVSLYLLNFSQLAFA